ncbi:hypothetical protein M0638_16275 [Roseomonas sp. NAR14]|uniref:Uncharacterized protein n=1 Tax=Roseomonas acroporae TaxID=2937791 RepID=A0A9X2BWD4_9PROT|nr:hypothetical protein [Roseomonas acroporae]MCK8785936.1 hypothetical protein [Roseomonas acroporae]
MKKPNYSQERAQRERAKAAKAESKAQRKREVKAAEPDARPEQQDGMPAHKDQDSSP